MLRVFARVAVFHTLGNPSAAAELGPGARG